MQKIIILCAVLISLTGCIRKMNIEQGNVLTPQLVSQLHIGMTETQVKEVLGTPVLLNTFNDNRVDYVYTMKPGHGPMEEKYITLTFKNNRLKNIGGNMYSTYIRN
ncbi:MAG: outer membrane protein assembly factor BamE [Gammaproteobacteria bacterium]|nr:outer membrane protein assembly factor BamE [Gammaproteobacteria bacterium]